VSAFAELFARGSANQHDPFRDYGLACSGRVSRFADVPPVRRPRRAYRGKDSPVNGAWLTKKFPAGKQRPVSGHKIAGGKRMSVAGTSFSTGRLDLGGRRSARRPQRHLSGARRSLPSLFSARSRAAPKHDDPGDNHEAARSQWRPDQWLPGADITNGLANRWANRSQPARVWARLVVSPCAPTERCFGLMSDRRAQRRVPRTGRDRVTSKKLSRSWSHRFLDLSREFPRSLAAHSSGVRTAGRTPAVRAIAKAPQKKHAHRAYDHLLRRPRGDGSQKRQENEGSSGDKAINGLGATQRFSTAWRRRR